MAPGVKPEHVDYYTGLFAKVMATPEWKKLMQDGASTPPRSRARSTPTGWRAKRRGTLR